MNSSVIRMDTLGQMDLELKQHIEYAVFVEYATRPGLGAVPTSCQRVGSAVEHASVQVADRGEAQDNVVDLRLRDAARPFIFVRMALPCLESRRDIRGLRPV